MEQVNNHQSWKLLQETNYPDTNMSDTQNMLIVNTRTLNQDFLDTPELSLTAGLISEQNSSSKATLSFHSSPTTSQLAAEPFLFDISDSPSKQQDPHVEQILETPPCSSEAPKPAKLSKNDWSEDGEEAWKGKEHDENDGALSAAQSAEADLAFLLDTQSPILPLTRTSPVLEKQIRDELDAISLLQSKGISAPVNSNAPCTNGPVITDTPLEMGGNRLQQSPEHSENDSAQLLQSAMYFMPAKTYYNNHSQPEQGPCAPRPTNTSIPTSGLRSNENAPLGLSLPSVEPGATSVNPGTKRTFAAAAVAAVGGRRNFDEAAEGDDGTLSKEEVQRGGKRAKIAANNTKNSRKGFRIEGRGRNEGKWNTAEAAEATTTPQLSEEELRKLRRVKNRASVEKCRTKQRLRMEALQVEQKCLMSECTVIRDALGKVETVLREACRYGQLLGVTDQIRERVNRLLGRENDALDLTAGSILFD